MQKQKRKTPFIVVGLLLIVSGIITFIVSAVQLYDVQHTQSRWAEGFMQDYQNQTNATNSIPCYIFMVLAVVMVIAGIILLCIKPRTQVTTNILYGGAQSAETLICPSCRAAISAESIFCNHCGYKLGAVVPRKICPTCGHPNANDSLFCESCGGRLN